MRMDAPGDGGEAQAIGAPAAPHGAVPWIRAIRRAVVMLVACYVTFVLVPNDLLTYLSRHTTPQRRDLLVTLWWAASFVACCGLFVRLQRKPER